MTNKRVLIGSIVHEHPSILRKFLTSLAELELIGLAVDYLFIDNNIEEAISRLFADFARKQGKTSIVNTNDLQQHCQCNEDTNGCEEEQIWKIARLKDELIKRARKENYDYLFLVDSDLVLHPYTLAQLVKADKDIVSGIFWTRTKPDNIEMPQVWLEDQYTLYRKRRDETLSEEEVQRRTEEFLSQLRRPGIYEVGGLGGCVLISRKALAAGVCFAEIKNLSFRGEDRHFSIRAVALGFSLFVDTHFPAYHIQLQSDLAGGQNEGITISLCMIVKNEEDVLARCLSSVKDVTDEIIIVDTGSTDHTKKIAGQFTGKIYDFEWIDDFSAARNYAYSLATQEYILWLDADDFFEERDRRLLHELKRTLDPTINSVTMHYHLTFDHEGNVTHSIRRNRLVRRDCGFRWVGAVHECLVVGGKTINSDIAVSHKKEKAYTDRNLQIYRRRLKAGEEFSPRDLYYYANELKDNAFYEEATLYYEKFLGCKLGWLEDNIAACLRMAECYGHMRERDKQLQSLLRTLEYDLPRAEACCQIGLLFFNENQLDKAVFWYDLATNLKKPSETLGKVDHAAWSWLPHLQLCVCYDRLGNLEKARMHNDIALSYNPTHPSMLYNKLYFDKKLSEI